MADRINGNKISHSSAICIQNMKITKSFCQELLKIKSVKCIVLHLVLSSKNT